MFWVLRYLFVACSSAPVFVKPEHGHSLGALASSPRSGTTIRHNSRNDAARNAIASELGREQDHRGDGRSASSSGRCRLKTTRRRTMVFYDIIAPVGLAALLSTSSAHAESGLPAPKDLITLVYAPTFVRTPSPVCKSANTSIEFPFDFQDARVPGVPFAVPRGNLFVVTDAAYGGGGGVVGMVVYFQQSNGSFTPPMIYAEAQASGSASSAGGTSGATQGAVARAGEYICGSTVAAVGASYPVFAIIHGYLTNPDQE